MRHVRIVGGPAPVQIRIYDSETGADLTSLFYGLKVHCNAHEGTSQLAKVELLAFVELDLEAEVAAVLTRKKTA
jgi:hypothetical protein